jgi:aminoglycoside/choline kinase family phosphotransferase
LDVGRFPRLRAPIALAATRLPSVSTASRPTTVGLWHRVSSEPNRLKTNERLLRQTRIHFPRFEEASVEITPIEKGGSDRKFYRVGGIGSLPMGFVTNHGLEARATQTLILVKYNLEREENRHYVALAEFLAEHNIRAPKIYFHDAEEGLIWLEDLGTTDLWSYREESWLVRRAFYESAIDEIVKLHCLPAENWRLVEQDLPAPFDAALYRWEQDYFFENCLGRHFGVPEEKRSELAALPALAEVATRLGERPRVLIHRDFQSQNIMIRNAQAHLIDFQGMRPGLAEYDLASLLFDPYVTLAELEREELLANYEETRISVGRPVSSDFRSIFRLSGIQRLMQALGAYGFLGLVRGNTSFLNHIPAAMKSLRGLVGNVDGLEALAVELRAL